MTLGTMKARIADELARSDLTTQIQSEIQSAINHYKHRRFLFNELEATSVTVKDEEFIAAPADMIEIDQFRVTISNRTYPLDPVAYGEITDVDETLYSGHPVRYALYNQQIRLYPTPNDAYPLIISYLTEFGPLNQDTDTNAWMDDGEELIRERARAGVKIRYLYDADAKGEASLFASRGQSYLSGLEQSAFNALKSRTDKYISVGGLRTRYL